MVRLHGGQVRAAGLAGEEVRLKVGGVLRVDAAVDGASGKESIPGVEPVFEVEGASGSRHPSPS
jgi:hypothetical protein